MHERSLVQSVLAQVEQLMAEYSQHSLIELRLSVGEFSGIDPELFCCAFDEMVRETDLSGTRLHLDCVPLQAACLQCGAEFTVADFDFTCPQCGSPQTRILRGEELMLESLVMEECPYEQA
jgi:hydrogenase nickel incorporation protein HypA/HybF